MTPKHQQIIDEVLIKIHQRTQFLVDGCDYPIIGRRLNEQTAGRMRESEVGRHLAALAEYAEGYPYAFKPDVRHSANFIGRMLFAETLRPNHWRVPYRLHLTDFGKLFYAALARFYEEERPGQLLTVAQVGEQFQVARQTVHQWIEGGDIPAIYIGDSPYLYQKDLATFQKIREKREQSKPKKKKPSGA